MDCHELWTTTPTIQEIIQKLPAIERTLFSTGGRDNDLQGCMLPSQVNAIKNRLNVFALNKMESAFLKWTITKTGGRTDIRTHIRTFVHYKEGHILCYPWLFL